MSESHIVHHAPAGGNITSMPTRATTVTPSDTTVHELGITVFAGGAGDVVVEPYKGGNTVTFTVVAGGVIPVVCRRVLATGTTATGLVGVY